MNTQDILLIVLSIGFVVLIAFVCVALGAMIRILVDIRKITERVQQEIDNVGDTIQTVSDKTKNFLANSLVIDKVVPAILGIISVSAGLQKMKQKDKKSTGATKRGKKFANTEIYEDDEEID